MQFLLEAVVLAAIGASIGTLGGTALCRALSDKFPWGLVVNPYGLAAAWGIALVLAVAFGLYPAIRGVAAVADGGDAVGLGISAVAQNTGRGAFPQWVWQKTHCAKDFSNGSEDFLNGSEDFSNGLRDFLNGLRDFSNAKMIFPMGPAIFPMF